MSSSSSESSWLAWGVASSGVLIPYLGYNALIVPLLSGGGAVSPLLWAVFAGMAPVALLISGMLARRGAHLIALGVWAGCLRKTMEAVLVVNHMPGFKKSEVLEHSVSWWVMTLVLEAGVWSVVAWLGSVLGRALHARNARRALQAR